MTTVILRKGSVADSVGVVRRFLPEVILQDTETVLIVEMIIYLRSM